MSTELMQTKIDDAGRIIFSPEPQARKAFFEAVYSTTIGKEFLKYRTPESVARLSEILQEKFLDKDSDILVDDAVAVIRDLLLAKDPEVIPLVPVPGAVVQDTRPRHADGTFKSEHEIWASDPNRSMREIRDRANYDSAFRLWFHRTSIAQTIQDGGLRIAGASRREATQADHRVGDYLKNFLKAYHAAPADRLKPRGGRVMLDEKHSYSPSEFEQLLSQASLAGLL